MPELGIPSYVIEVLTKIEDCGHEVYVVGGSCRDIIIGRVPYDFDVCTSALPQDIMEIFPNSIPTGIAHGTVSVRAGKELIEVTTFRCDGEYKDHRRPDAVVFSSDLSVDLMRRDFTMNAIAMDKSGRIFDPFGGIADINSACIRCVGKASQRFSEDALRMLRAVRFSAQLGFSLDDDIILAMKKLADTVSFVAPERVFAETTRALCSPKPEALSLAISSGIYSRYVDVSKSVNLASLALIPADSTLRYCALCAILCREGLISSASEFLRKLKAPSALIKTASKILDPCPIWQGEANLARLVSRVGRADAMALACAMGADVIEPMQKLLSENRPLSISELAIDGRNLQAMGISGREIGIVLNKLLEHLIDYPEDNTLEKLSEIILNLK